MRPGDYEHLADLLRRRAGLLLTPDKMLLARKRLLPVADLFGFPNLDALLAELPYPTEEIARAITEAMTTHDTSFFRDAAFFRFFAQRLLPQLAESRRTVKRLRIWCAAVATGQEAYSLAMVVSEAGLKKEDWRIDLIATDISEAAIVRAREGVYSAYEMERGLPADLRARYFVQDNETWRVSDHVRSMISFRTFNLLDHFGWLGQIDAVLCRNVLIYFDPAVRSGVMAKLHDVLAADGHLLLGDNEAAGKFFAAAPEGPSAFVKPQRGLRLRALSS